MTCACLMGRDEIKTLPHLLVVKILKIKEKNYRALFGVLDIVKWAS